MHRPRYRHERFAAFKTSFFPSIVIAESYYQAVWGDGGRECVDRYEIGVVVYSATRTPTTCPSASAPYCFFLTRGVAFPSEL